jgi:hypothetical protein
MNSSSTSIFKDPNVAKHLSLLNDKYVIVSAEKAPNNIVCVCKSHFIDCLIKELLIIWKEVSWSIWQIHQYSTV